MKRRNFFGLYKNRIKRKLSRLFGVSKVKVKIKIQNLFDDNHRPLKTMVAVLMLIVIFVNIFQVEPGQIAQGATYTFLQTDWSGGVSTTAIAVHPTNQTGWNYYNSASGIDFSSSTNLGLTSSTYSFTDDGTIITTGDDTGGGFGNGTVSSVTISGSGSFSQIQLATTSQTTEDTFDTVMKGVPVVVGDGGDIEYTANGIYVLVGLDSNDVYKYTTSTNSWTQLTDMPGISWFPAADLESDSTYLYVYPDNNNKNVFRHLLSNTTDPWDTFSQTGISNVLSYGSLQVDASYIYVFDTTGKQALRHTVSDTSSAWQGFATTSMAAGASARIKINSTDIFVLPSQGATTTYKHTLSNTSSAWVAYPNFTALGNSSIAALEVTETSIFVAEGHSNSRVYGRDIADTVTAWATTTPSSGMAGPTMAKDDTNVYLNEGGTTPRFFQRALADTSSAWTEFTSNVPARAYKNTGGTVEVGGGNIYVLRGGTTREIYTHTTADTTSAWGGVVTSTFPFLPGTPSDGAALAKDGNYVYASKGNGTLNIYRHDLTSSTKQWDSLTTTGAAGFSSAGRAIAVDDSNIYLLVSSNSTVYRKTTADTSTAWVSFGTGLGTISGGADLAIMGNYAYVLRGNNTTNTYRHTITTTTGAWEQFSALPGNVSTGGGMDLTPTDIYVLGTASSTVYKHTLSDTSSAWISFTTTTGAPGQGGGIKVDGTNVYVLRGGSFKDVYVHTLSDTSSAWSTYSTTNMTNVGTGGAIALTDSDIYVTSGGSAAWSRHTLSDTSSSWTSLMASPGGFTFSNGGDIIATGNSELILLLGANSTNRILRYIVNTTIYVASGNFTSASVDIGASSFSTISWTSSTPSILGANSLQIQVATSSDNSTWSSFVGSDGTTGTYFTSPGQSASALGSARYVKYKAYLQTANTAYSPVLSDITFNYTAFSSTSTLVSSIFDSLDATNIVGSIKWAESRPTGTDVLFQIRTASTSALISDAVFMGPDGTSSTYFTDPTAVSETVTSTQRDGVNDRFVQYRATLTSVGANTPSLNSATVTYVVNAVPETQSVTATPNASSTVVITYQVRDSDTGSGSINPGYVSSTFQYCANATTTGCVSITAFPSGTGISNAVTTSNWTSYTATWTPKTDLGSSIYDANAVIKVTVNDNEAANNTATATSSAFILDTGAPSGGAVVVEASSTPAYLTISASDTSSFQMKLSLNSDMAGADWQDYVTTSTISLVTDPDTVYAQFKDAYGNTSTIVSATTPETPTSTMIQDISNLIGGVAEYRLFIAWKVVANPSPGFGSYKVYRSTDQTNWSLLSTITGRTTNFYTDSAVVSGTLNYYRLITTDSSGNTSYYSATSSGNPNGTQDGTEGGGVTAAAAQPTISNTSTSALTPTSATIIWDTDVLSNSRIGYSTTPGNFTDNVVTVASMKNNEASVGQHAVVLAGLAPSTTYYFQIRSDNVDGVTSTAPTSGNGYSLTTLNGTTISSVANTEVANNRAVITWDTTNNASSWVVFSTSSGFTVSTATGTAADSVTAHSVTVTGLSSATQYYYYVYSIYNSVTTSDKNVLNGEITYYRFTTTNDTTAPTISGIVESPLAGTSTITWATNEQADSQIIYGTSTNYGSTTTLDSTMTIQHSVILTSLSASTVYHYKIRSTDTNGNLGQSSGDRTFTTDSVADTTAPIISNVATSSISLTGATISWSTNEVSNFLIDYGATGSYGSVAGDASDYTTSTHSVTLSGLSGNTTYYFRVRSQDASGNTATSSQGSFLTIPDTTNPVISNVTTAVVNQDSAVITWNTDEPATSVVDYNTNTVSFVYTNTTSTLQTAHSVTLTSLVKDTIYYYQVKSADASSNNATDTNSGTYFTFTSLKTPGDTIIIIGGGGGGAAIDRNPPSILNVQVSTITPESAIVTWDSDEEGLSMLQYGITDKYGSIIGAGLDKKTKHSIGLNNLKSATSYHFKALTYDASGNIGESQDKTFATLNIDGTVADVASTTAEAISGEEEAMIDAVKSASANVIIRIFEALMKNPLLSKIPEDIFVKILTEMTDRVVGAPEIAGVKPIVEVAGTNAVIKWSTDKKSSSEVSYAREIDYQPNEASPYVSAAINPDEFSINHRVELTGLDAGTLYHFQVKSKALIGPEARSKDSTFQTSAELPVISDIKIAKAKDMQSSLVVNWRTSVSTAGTVEYTNRKTKNSLTQGDNTLLINHEIVLKGLEGGIDYTLVIKAKDEFNNEISSLPLTFSTTIDKVPPAISQLSSESTLYPGKDSKVQTIVMWETDEPATSQVFYQEGLAGDNVLNLPLDSSLNTRHIVVVTKFKPGAVYKYWVESKDLAGNTSKSEIFSILTPQEKETIIDIIINNFQSVFGWTKNLGI